MVSIDKTGFGYIVIDGKKYDEDIVLCKEEIMVRPKHLSRKYREKYGHTPLSHEELKEIIKHCPEPEVIVIGTGQYGALPLMDDALDYLKRLGVEFHLVKTPEAVDLVNKYTREGRKVLAIIHLTC